MGPLKVVGGMGSLGDAARAVATQPQSTPRLSSSKEKLLDAEKLLEPSRIVKILLGWVDYRGTCRGLASNPLHTPENITRVASAERGRV